MSTEQLTTADLGRSQRQPIDTTDARDRAFFHRLLAV
jgi:hypothetical protein